MILAVYFCPVICVCLSCDDKFVYVNVVCFVVSCFYFEYEMLEALQLWGFQ